MNPSTYSDDDLREKLAYYERQIVDRNRRYGGNNSTRSDRAMIDEAYISAYPWQQEAKARGITSSRLYDALMKMTDVSLQTLMKAIPKAMLADPTQITALQRVCLRRGLMDE